MTDHKPLSAALVSLSEVVAAAPDDQEPAPGFKALLNGVEYVMTAVLERTAVLELPGDRWADKEMARLDQLLVDPAAITWQPKPARPGRASWRGRRRPTADPQAQRAATDERARADQARRAAAQPARPRPRPAAVPAQGDVVAGGQPASRGAGGRPPQVATRTAAAVRTAPRASSTAVLLPAASSVPSPAPLPASRPTSARLPAPVREVADRLLWALDRIDELEAERERSQAAQRRLIRRARAAMARRAS
jgi:hypothetical protein